MFAFKVKDEVENFTAFDVSAALRERGWQVPAYTFPANRTDLAALRVVVRRGVSHDLGDLLIDDLKRCLVKLEQAAGTSARRGNGGLPPLGVGLAPEQSGAGGGAYVAPPPGAQMVSASGPGPFVTQARFRLADGRIVEWASRRHRKRAAGALGRAIAVNFIIGSLCFAVGSVPGYSSLVGATADAVTYFIGSIFFTTAGYLQYVECISASPSVVPDAPRRTRFVAFEGRRIDWWATTIQLAGTIAFNVTTFAALDTHLTPKGEDLVVWTPDAVGSICFLVASELAFAEAGHAWYSWRWRSMGWRIAAINLLGSIFFGLSAIAGWVQPATGDLLDAALDTSGTFWGAICFLIGAILLLVPDPSPTPPDARRARTRA